MICRDEWADSGGWYRWAQTQSRPPVVRIRPTVSAAGKSPLMSNAAATVRVDLTCTASMLDSASQTRQVAFECPCLVCPASHTTMATQTSLYDYRTIPSTIITNFFVPGFSPPITSAKKGKRKRAKGKMGLQPVHTLYLQPFYRLLLTETRRFRRACSISLQESSCIPRTDSARTAHCRGLAATGRPRPADTGTCRAAASPWPARRRSHRPASWESSPVASC